MLSYSPKEKSKVIKPSDDLVQPNILKLTPYVPRKPIEEIERELGMANIIKMASNENPLGSYTRPSGA